MPKVYTRLQTQSRPRRPNPRVRLEIDIEAAVTEVTAAIIAGLNAPNLEMFPVTRLAAPIVRQRFGASGEVLAEVVEAVLACPVARVALRERGLHLAGR
jgi:hypothetical protein